MGMLMMVVMVMMMPRLATEQFRMLTLYACRIKPLALLELRVDIDDDPPVTAVSWCPHEIQGNLPRELDKLIVTSFSDNEHRLDVRLYSCSAQLARHLSNRYSSFG